MNHEELNIIFQELKQIRRKIENGKHREKHIEKNRLFKLIDAELMDALHNLEKLINLTGEQV